MISIEGKLKISKTLKGNHFRYLQAFHSTKRISRSVQDLEDIPDPIRVNVGLPLGEECSFFVGRFSRASSIDHKICPTGQPSNWCPFYPEYNGNYLAVNPLAPDLRQGAFKFSNAEVLEVHNWLEYIINNFMSPWGYYLDGRLQIKSHNNYYLSDHQHDTIIIFNVKNNNISLLDLKAFV
jgi:hypothetical protein